MIKVFSSAGRIFEGTSEQLRQRLSLPRTATQIQPRQPGPRIADPAQAYSDLAAQNLSQITRSGASLMSRPPITISTLQTLSDAWHLMQQHDFAQLPVMNQTKQLVGMLSRTEVLKYLMMRDDQICFISAHPITELMEQSVIAVDEAEDVLRVALLMLDRDVNAVPVVNYQDQLTGIISRRDILRYLVGARSLALRA